MPQCKLYAFSSVFVCVAMVNGCNIRLVGTFCGWVQYPINRVCLRMRLQLTKTVVLLVSVCRAREVTDVFGSCGRLKGLNRPTNSHEEAIRT